MFPSALQHFGESGLQFARQQGTFVLRLVKAASTSVGRSASSRMTCPVLRQGTVFVNQQSPTAQGEDRLGAGEGRFKGSSSKSRKTASPRSAIMSGMDCPAVRSDLGIQVQKWQVQVRRQDFADSALTEPEGP
jgi:hypothetical protein